MILRKVFVSLLLILDILFLDNYRHFDFQTLRIQSKHQKFLSISIVTLWIYSRDGILSNLENLQCFQWEVCLETMLFIIDQCPVLRHIWGLDLLMLSPQSITAIQQHITKNNRHIDLHDGMSTSDDSSTKGQCKYDIMEFHMCKIKELKLHEIWKSNWKHVFKRKKLL